MYGKVKDPQIVVDVSIRGRQPNYGTNDLEDINSFLKRTIRITTDFQIVSSAYYSAGFIPPKAEGETRYKITWTLSNSINNVNQAEANGFADVCELGRAISGQNEKISYNEVTRDIVWDIGTVYPTSGVNSEREVLLIVILKPSLSQVGSAPQLMKTLYLTGKDEFYWGLD